MDVRNILPTSNICETIFLIAKHTVHDCSRAILPVNLEMQMFLRYDASLFSLQDMNGEMNQANKK